MEFAEFMVISLYLACLYLNTYLHKYMYVLIQMKDK